MPSFKRLTRLSEADEQIDVNMETVLHMQRFTDHTTMYFAVQFGESALTLAVRETPDQIHMTAPLPSAGTAPRIKVAR